MSDAARDEHWRRLRAERAAARAALVGSLDALSARARDPLRLKERMRRHPVLFAGVAAGAAAFLVRQLAGGRDAAPTRASPDLMQTLRDAALRVATPWVTRFVEEHLGGRDGEDQACAANGTETGHTSN